MVKMRPKLWSKLSHLIHMVGGGGPVYFKRGGGRLQPVMRWGVVAGYMIMTGSHEVGGVVAGYMIMTASHEVGAGYSSLVSPAGIGRPAVAAAG